MCACVYCGNQNIENGLNSFFFEKEIYLPFFFVRLVRVSVHSGRVSCTFRSHFVQMPYGFGTVGSVYCTIGFLVQLVRVCVLLYTFLVQLATLSVHLVYSYVQMDVET